MNDTAPNLRRQTLLASLAGARPSAPPWFDQALADAPERGFTEAAGARIETLTWGERGRPGLLFLHGNGAHADWWSFIAPFFSSEYRCTALSWSGMGGSDRRERYSFDIFVKEAMTIAEATGLFENGAKPVFIGHSFGGFPIIEAAARHGERLGGGIIIDTPIFSPERRKERKEKGAAWEMRPHKIYPTLEDALQRFRLVPAQPCENLFIADFIARTSLTQVETAEEAGWTWRFDPYLWRDYEWEDPAPALSAPKCPLAVLLGARSTLMQEGDIARMRKLLPPGTPVIDIPEAYHHVPIDQPLALVAALRAVLAGWASASASGENTPMNSGLA
ncbi:alpha/beta fold hydrolase [Microvirga arabica]|uniref:Alpha/beta fold hydrolase n=1 Tax=Microvirga arabica TaxID=1128671 RepID=A0ABV6Y8G1_9HYPH|nr:alpha/beta hydrolase [Microvirga arabica]MBM1171140.1 alpha/beta hydrolase [Microvirga arabica]